MDNLSEETKNSIPEVAYSSQDILSNSLAGKKGKFFTRIKKTKKPKLNKSPIDDSTDKHKNRRNKKIAILCITAASIVILVIVAILLAWMNAPKNADNNETTTDGTSVNNSSDSLDNDESQKEDIPEDISALRPDPNDKSISQADYSARQINYINALIDSKLLIAAGNELESAMSNIEMNPEGFTDCQLASVYKAMNRLEQAGSSKDETEAVDSDATSDGMDGEGNVNSTTKALEKMRKAAETCNE